MICTENTVYQFLGLSFKCFLATKHIDGHDDADNAVDQQTPYTERSCHRHGYHILGAHIYVIFQPLDALIDRLVKITALSAHDILFIAPAGNLVCPIQDTIDLFVDVCDQIMDGLV